MTGRRSRILWAALAMAACVVPVDVAGAEVPRRIVSANLCADRLVLRLAPRAHVLSVSTLAGDPSLSTVADDARGLTTNRGGAEEILALRPDLVVVGTVAPRGGAALLRKLGVAVHAVPAVPDLEAARVAIRELAARLGARERGEALVAALDDRLAALAPPVPGRRALSLHAGGWVAGEGTLAADVLARAGIANAAADLNGFRSLDIEALVARAPDLIAVERAPGDVRSLAGGRFRHPAIAGAVPVRVEIAARDWVCPDDALSAAAVAIAAAMR
jgi:iron complex transport system substrate-binding protein